METDLEKARRDYNHCSDGESACSLDSCPNLKSLIAAEREDAASEMRKERDEAVKQNRIHEMTHRFDVGNFHQQRERAEKAEKERDSLKEQLAGAHACAEMRAKASSPQKPGAEKG